MSENALAAIFLCLVMTSCTACTISDRWIAHEREMKKSPLERCLEAAWRDAARIECKALYGKGDK